MTGMLTASRRIRRAKAVRKMRCSPAASLATSRVTRVPRPKSTTDGKIGQQVRREGIHRRCRLARCGAARRSMNAQNKARSTKPVTMGATALRVNRRCSASWVRAVGRIRRRVARATPGIHGRRHNKQGANGNESYAVGAQAHGEGGESELPAGPLPWTSGPAEHTSRLMTETLRDLRRVFPTRVARAAPRVAGAS